MLVEVLGDCVSDDVMQEIKSFKSDTLALRRQQPLHVTLNQRLYSSVLHGTSYPTYVRRRRRRKESKKRYFVPPSERGVHGRRHQKQPWDTYVRGDDLSKKRARECRGWMVIEM